MIKSVVKTIIAFIVFIPIFVYADTLPSKYDLRNVNGHSYITPPKDQGSEGLCWDYGAMAHLESRVMFEENKPYDSNSIVFSEKQNVYAAAAVTTNGRKAYNSFMCAMGSGHVGSGGGFACASEVLVDGLGAVSNAWDVANRQAIENDNAQVDSDVVYNFGQSLYELNSTIEIPEIYLYKLNSTKRQEMLKIIKENVMKYGGAVIDTDVAYQSRNYYNGIDTMTVCAASDSVSFAGSMGHSMALIGWDDDFEYKVCKHATGYAYPDQDCPGDMVTGKGVWIAKNSWADDDNGSVNSIVLIGYDTYYGFDISFYKDISEKNWDNFYQLDSEYIDTTARKYFFKEGEYILNEKINKIKIWLTGGDDYKIYISESGNDSYQKIGEVDADFNGYYYFDLSSKSYHISNNTTFKIKNSDGAVLHDFRVYTDNPNNTSSAQVKTVTYDRSKYNNYVTFNLDTRTKNIDDSVRFTYKIKDSSNNYVSTSNYSYEYNMVYANINSTKFKLDNYSIGNGTYTIETYYNNSLLCSSQLVVEGNIQYHAPLFQLSGLVKDDNYKLFKNITIGTTVHAFFSTTKNNDVLEIYTKDSNLVYNKSNPDTIMKIATGMYVTFYDDDLNKVKYTFSVKGDANGDGIISSKDYVVIRKHLMETAIITDTAELMASDYNMDNNITSKDYVQIRKYLMSS